MAFNPEQHLTDIKGRKYLDVKWRIVWFRESHPKGRIETELFTVGDMIVARATIVDSHGEILASGSSTVRDAKQNEATWAGRVVEKAETAAIGRALAHAGFGTQFTGEDDGDNLADSPVDRKQSKSNEKPANQVKDEQRKAVEGGENGEIFSDEISEIVVKKSSNGKMYRLISGNCLWNRDAFRELGYLDEIIDKLNVEGRVKLPDPVRIAYTEKKKADGTNDRTPTRMQRVKSQLVVTVNNKKE